MKTAQSLMIVALCLGGTGVSLAADQAQPGMMSASQADQGRGAMRHQRMDPRIRVQHRLDTLATKLHLAPTQQPAWQTYSSAMMDQATERFQQREQRPTQGNDKRNAMSTPDRMELMASRMRANADQLSKVASQTKTFYAQLSPEQQTIFDLYAREARHGRMEHGRGRR